MKIEKTGGRPGLFCLYYFLVPCVGQVGAGKENTVTPAFSLVTPAQAGVGLYSVSETNQKLNVVKVRML